MNLKINNKYYEVGTFNDRKIIYLIFFPFICVYVRVEVSAFR